MGSRIRFLIPCLLVPGVLLASSGIHQALGEAQPLRPSYLLVHALNPEGVELSTLRHAPHFWEDLLSVYVDGHRLYPDAVGAYACCQPAGAHTVRAEFNGMSKEESIVLDWGETRSITFVFDRTEFDLAGVIQGIDLSYDASVSGTFDLEDPCIDNYATSFEDRDGGEVADAGAYASAFTPWEDLGYLVRVQGAYSASASLSVKGTSCRADIYVSYSGACYPPNAWGELCEAGSWAGIRPVSASIGYVPPLDGFDVWCVQSVRCGIYPSIIGLWDPPEGGEASCFVSGSHSCELPYCQYSCHITAAGRGYLLQVESLVDQRLSGSHAGPAYPASWEGSGSVTAVKMSSVPYDITGTGNKPPIAFFDCSPTDALVGDRISFDAKLSYDPDGAIIEHYWDFGDGTTARGRITTHAYSEPGEYWASLVVTDDRGLQDGGSRKVKVGGDIEIDVTPQYPGEFFLQGIDVGNQYDVRIDWKGATPYGVHFVANGEDWFMPTSGNSASRTFNMGMDFITGINLDTNTLKVYAESKEGRLSESWVSHPVILPIPDWARFLGPFLFTHGVYVLKAQYPKPPFKAETDTALPSGLPIVGGHKLGVGETYASMTLGFELNGVGKIDLRGQTGFTAGGNSIEGSLGGTGRFGYTSYEGLKWMDANFCLGVHGQFNTPKVGVIDAIPQLAPLADLPGLSDINKLVCVWGTLSPGVDLDARLVNSDGKIVFDRGEAVGTVREVINARAGTDRVSLTLYGGGKILVTIQVPEPYLKNIVAGIFLGAEAKVGKYSVWPDLLPHEFEKTWTLYGTSPESRPSMSSLMDGAGPLLLRRSDRSYFTDSTYNQLVTPQPERQAALPAGSAWSTGEKLVENVFPDGEVTIGAFGDDLLLVWMYDDPADPDFQHTEIAYSYFERDGWSEPRLVANDTRFEKSPVVQFDASGKAVCVWERIKDPNFTGTQLEEILPLSEIVYSVYDPSTSTWSSVAAITDNDILDHSAVLKRSPSGDVVLVWEQNAANLLMGDNSDLPKSASILSLCVWNHEGRAWSTPTEAPVQLTGVASWDLDCTDQEVTIVYSQDLDADLSTPTDSEIFLISYDLASSSWSTPLRWTNDNLPDVMPNIVYDNCGNWVLVWGRDGLLVSEGGEFGNFWKIWDAESASSVAREVVRTADGHIIVYWLEQRAEFPDIYDEFPDIYYVVRDTSWRQGCWEDWSSVRRLTFGDSLEGGFKAVAVGDDIVSVYMDRETLYETRRMEVNGQQITLENIPCPGRTDLCLYKHRLIADLAMGEMSVTGDVVPGGNVTVMATIRNIGDISMQDIPVGFYYALDGGPLVEITKEIIASPIPIGAGSCFYVPLHWTLPDEDMSQTIFAIIDPELTLWETPRPNTYNFISLVHPDIVLAPPRSELRPDGNIVITGSVSNEGQISSPGFAVLCEDICDGAAEVARAWVSRLGAGENQEIKLEISDWTMRVGNQLMTYRLTAGPNGVAGETDTQNNVVFVSIVMVDADQDGIPDFWELEYGTSDNNAHDALLDPDEDGLTNLDEFKCRTDPGKCDTDSDRMEDGWETTVGLDPNTDDAEADNDGDGLRNLEEMRLGTNPLASDTDGDGVDDGTEVLHGTSPTSADSVFRILGITLDPDGKPVLSWRSIAGKRHNVYVTSDLSTGWGSSRDTIEAEPSGFNVWTDEEGQGTNSRFYRLDISDAP